jgi:pyruvate dehydrogenase E2 component (dihydrolipoamide acetyltransferase)
MPKLSPTMEMGTIAKWLKQPGDRIEAGDALFEVATDKATVEHAALDEGYLRQILVQEGQEAPVNQPLAICTETKEESIENYQPKAIEIAPPAVKAQAAPIAKTVETAPKSTLRVTASPLAKKLADRQGVDLSKVQGSGPRGRIVAKDLEDSHTSVPSEAVQEIPLSPVRKVISRRLQEAKGTIPHFYVTMKIDAEKLVDFREQLSHLEVKVSFNDCIVKACALALKEHPVVNSGFHPTKNAILQFNTIDVSVAVDTPSGLITPIVTSADQKSISEISAEIRALAQKAKAGKLAPAEFQGGSFTVSNLGMFGVESFAAILNPPQAAILAVGGILDEAVIKNGVVRPGKVMHLTLSADHRVVDGVKAAEFLGTLKKMLEQPIALLI